jgi:hypothetical protein
MREERWTGDEEGDEEVQAGEKGDEEIEHDNALKTLQFMKASTMIHAHQYEVVDHVDAHDRLDRPHSSPSHRKPRSREAEKPKAAAAAAQQGLEPGSFISKYWMLTGWV